MHTIPEELVRDGAAISLHPRDLAVASTPMWRDALKDALSPARVSLLRYAPGPVFQMSPTAVILAISPVVRGRTPSGDRSGPVGRSGPFRPAITTRRDSAAGTASRTYGRVGENPSPQLDVSKYAPRPWYLWAKS